MRRRQLPMIVRMNERGENNIKPPQRCDPLD
jgi:hypothetical protein